MKKLLLLLLCAGCVAPVPTMPTPSYYLRFTKDIDSLAVVPNVQTFKVLTVETNLPDQKKVGWESDILLKVRTGVDMGSIAWVDTVSTVNCCSYTYKGSVKTVFGGFDILRGKTATVTVTTKINQRILADTLKLILY